MLLYRVFSSYRRSGALHLPYCQFILSMCHIFQMVDLPLKLVSSSCLVWLTIHCPLTSRSKCYYGLIGEVPGLIRISDLD